MSVLSTLLMLLATKQLPTLRGMGTGWAVPAATINSLINGPGYYMTAPIPIPIPHAVNERLSFEGSRLLGIAVFWFLIGLSIDRKTVGSGRNYVVVGEKFPLHSSSQSGQSCPIIPFQDGSPGLGAFS
jgi:hypothetical protein